MYDDYPATGSRYQAYHFTLRSPKTILKDQENEKCWNLYNKHLKKRARFKLAPCANTGSDSEGKKTGKYKSLVYGYTVRRQGEMQQGGVPYDGWVSTISSELLLPLLSSDLTESERLVQTFSLAKTVGILLTAKSQRMRNS